MTFGGVPDDDPYGEDYMAKLDEIRDPGCPLCEARDDEPHQPHCSMFVPECHCGRPARRMVGGEWYCTKCAPDGRVRVRAA